MIVFAPMAMAKPIMFCHTRKERQSGFESMAFGGRVEARTSWVISVERDIPLQLNQLKRVTFIACQFSTVFIVRLETVATAKRAQRSTEQ
jgi:hypothetical protein